MKCLCLSFVNNLEDFAMRFLGLKKGIFRLRHRLTVLGSVIRKMPFGCGLLSSLNGLESRYVATFSSRGLLHPHALQLLNLSISVLNNHIRISLLPKHRNWSKD
jgi:hypothetical protein